MRNTILKILMPLFLLMILQSASAQQSKPKYTGSFEAEAQKGGYETEVAMNTMHGIRFGSWSTSIGAGVDYYRYKSVPLYLDVKRFINAGKQQFYAQAAFGVNVAAPAPSEKLYQRYWSSSLVDHYDTISFGSGRYSKLAIGMIFNPRNKVKVNFSLGWSYKSMSTTKYEMTYYGGGAEYEPRKTIYGMNRFVLSLGIGI